MPPSVLADGLGSVVQVGTLEIRESTQALDVPAVETVVTAPVPLPTMTPLLVIDVAPVPPLATISVPPSVNTPDDVIGLAVEVAIVMPVVPPDNPTLLTLPVPPATHAGTPLACQVNTSPADPLPAEVRLPLESETRAPSPRLLALMAP